MRYNLNVHQQMNGWRRCGVYIYIQWNISHKKWIVSFAATWMQPEIIRVSKAEKESQCMWYNLHGKSKIWYKYTYL